MIEVNLVKIKLIGAIMFFTKWPQAFIFLEEPAIALISFWYMAQ